MSGKSFIKLLGPGLLYAGAAIGVSHLVQSTRAGATYGFDLLWILLLANFLKYPFFQFGPRYAAATGNNLIDGYRKIGKWALLVFVVLTVCTMFAVVAAVIIVTAGIAGNVLNLTLSTPIIAAILLMFALVLLGIGRYSMLDKVIKYVIVILGISTIVAGVYATRAGFHPDPTKAHHFEWVNQIDKLFLIAFVGWMPAPIDLSIWHSLWSQAKRKELGFSPSIKQSLLDFNIGYIGTVVLASCFLVLGAFIMYGSNEALSAKGVIFSGQLINMYTTTIGAWAYPVIAIAALATMVSTTLTSMDAYPRVLQRSTELLLPKSFPDTSNNRRLYWFWIILVALGGFLLLSLFSRSMRFMVDLATTLSFVTAPVLAYLNYRVICSSHVPAKARPGKFLRIYSWVGIVFLGLFSLFYVIWDWFLI